MIPPVSEWVLAFDGSCGACRGVAQAVKAACADKLDVLSLNHPDVVEWRSQAFRSEPPWTPTLLYVSGHQARAWTGTRMSLRLTRLLGMRSTFRVLRALGELRAQSSAGRIVTKESLEAAGLTRHAFLRRVGLGVVMVGGIIISGAIPATADPVEKWQELNAGSLPTKYSELKKLPLDYRKAAFEKMSAEQKSVAWCQHFDEVLTGRELSSDQQAVVLQAQGLAAVPSTFTDSNPSEQLKSLGDQAKQAFGAEAAAIVATLGPASTAADPYCACNIGDNYCSGDCESFTCRQLSSGCGLFWSKPCNGLCI